MRREKMIIETEKSPENRRQGLGEPVSAVSRRNLFLAGLGASSLVLTLTPSASEAAEGEKEKRKSRYQESAHVKKYYAVNRY